MSYCAEAFENRCKRGEDNLIDLDQEFKQLEITHRSSGEKQTLDFHPECLTEEVAEGWADRSPYTISTFDFSKDIWPEGYGDEEE